ncbi:hypothetical protein ACCO45_011604 [Purpureocillium lilacinum]|uniref:Uncharacterized protein n=1 Tax=Purpureocillium lilacinum TaxID=33203 RepID=A0ACC4DEA1_PURLI
MDDGCRRRDDKEARAGPAPTEMTPTRQRVRDGGAGWGSQTGHTRRTEGGHPGQEPEMGRGGTSHRRQRVPFRPESREVRWTVWARPGRRGGLRRAHAFRRPAVDEPGRLIVQGMKAQHQHLMRAQAVNEYEGEPRRGEPMLTRVVLIAGSVSVGARRLERLAGLCLSAGSFSLLPAGDERKPAPRSMSPRRRAAAAGSTARKQASKASKQGKQAIWPPWPMAAQQWSDRETLRNENPVRASEDTRCLGTGLSAQRILVAVAVQAHESVLDDVEARGPSGVVMLSTE